MSGQTRFANLRKQSEDTALVKALTAIVREADESFRNSGGGSRHWVRDNFLPVLNQWGFFVVCHGVTCAHCGMELRQIDGDWCDRETGSTCNGGNVKHAPKQPVVPPGADPTEGK